MEKDVKKSVKDKKGKSEVSPEPIIYIGDNLGLELRKDTVFIGGIPERFNKYFESVPEIKHLFVPLDKLVESKVKLQDSTSIECLSNQAVQEYLRKGV